MKTLRQLKRKKERYSEHRVSTHERARRHFGKNSCEMCGMTNEEHRLKYGNKGLQIHCMNGKNNYHIHNRENWKTLCVKCHARLHREIGDLNNIERIEIENKKPETKVNHHVLYSFSHRYGKHLLTKKRKIIMEKFGLTLEQVAEIAGLKQKLRKKRGIIMETNEEQKYKLSEQTREKMSLARKGKPSNRKGKKMTKEERKKLRYKKRGPYKPSMTPRRQAIMEKFGLSLEDVIWIDRLYPQMTEERVVKQRLYQRKKMDEIYKEQEEKYAKLGKKTIHRKASEPATQEAVS